MADERDPQRLVDWFDLVCNDVHGRFRANASSAPNGHGNSVRGIRVFEQLSQDFDLHVFDEDRPWNRRD